MKNLFIIILGATFLLSCGPSSYTACECSEIKGNTKASSEEVKWCADKEASDSNFAQEVKNCAIKALGYDPKQVNSNASPEKKPGTYMANTSKSKIKWTGKKVIGEHSGLIKVKSGEFVLANDGSISTGKIVTDMTSISVTDIEDEKSNADLVGHLKSPDFFNTESHGEAIFEITSADNNDAQALNVKGNLTIKGVTKPASGVMAVIPSKNIDGQITVAGRFTFDRTEYDITYPGMADNAIQDEVTLQITLVGNAK